MSFQLWGGTRKVFYQEIVHSLYGQTGRQVRQPDWGALGPCSRLRRRDFSCTSKYILVIPPAVMGFAILHFMQRTMKGGRAQTKLIKKIQLCRIMTKSWPKKTSLQRTTESPWHLGEFLAKIFAWEVFIYYYAA